MTKSKQILLVDDDDLLRERLSRALEARGHSVRTALDFDTAVAAVADAKPDWVVVDLKMPGRSGMELLAELRRIDPAMEVVMLTGYGSIANAVEAVRAGAVNYVTKPADADQIVEAFRRGEGAPPADAGSISAPSLAEAEWNHIQQVLADCDRNITQAAIQLGIPRRTLQRKLKKLAP